MVQIANGADQRTGYGGGRAAGGQVMAGQRRRPGAALVCAGPIAGDHESMADHRPNQHQTVMAAGAALHTLQYVRDRDLVAGHIGRYIIGWAQLDARLSMVVAHWTGTSGSDPHYNKMGTNKSHIKVDKLADRFDPDWRDGVGRFETRHRVYADHP